jgi:hypothetical protein
MRRHRLDFMDLIASVDVDRPDNYADDYLDPRVFAWQDVCGHLEPLKDLRVVAFSRKTFSGIPNMARQVAQVAGYCQGRGVRFCMLPSPARIFSAAKVDAWRAGLSKL